MDDLPEREVQKLLDDGTVTPEEAERLLSAIREGVPDEDRGPGLTQCGERDGSAHSALPGTWHTVAPTRSAAKGVGLLIAGGFIGAGLAIGFMGLVLFGLGIVLMGLAVGVAMFPFALVGGAAAKKFRRKGSTVALEVEARQPRERRAIPQRLPRKRRLADGSPGGDGDPEDA